MLRRALGRVAAVGRAATTSPTAATSTAVAAPPTATAAAAAVGSRWLSTTTSAPGKDGFGKPPKKSQADIFKDFEASLDANELRPLLAENAEELLREAAEAVPFAPGYRGSRRKKRERERLRVVRRGDYVKKLQVVARHEERMQARSGAAIAERLARLGLPPLPPKQQGAAGAKQQAEE